MNDFDTAPILKDIHEIIHSLNLTLEYFNGMSHKTIKSIRKHLLYLNDHFRAIEQSLKDGQNKNLLSQFMLKIIK